jgi:O-antigen/teichoic acid export membrane protein
MKRSWYATPYALWMLLFAVVPLLFVCWYAFTTPEGHFTLANFQEFSKPRYLGIILRSLKLALLYGCLFCGLEFLLSRELCLWLYGSEEAGRHLGLYALLIPMLYCDAITDAMTKGLGQQKICVRYNILTSALDVIFLYLLLPRYGMIGYFISFFVTHLLNFCLSLRLLLKITKLKIPFYIPALTLSATLAAAFGASFLQNIPMQIGAYLSLLMSLLTLFRVISKDDIFWLKGLLIQK